MRWLLLLLLPAPASAATFFVEAAGGGPYQDIQPALDAARDGDLVLVAPGSYGPIDFDGKGVEVRAVEPGPSTTIDGGGLGPAVRFGERAPAEALLHGFTVTGGVGLLLDSVGTVAGGGILVTRASTPRISGNTITDNTAETGGGIAVINAAPEIFGNTIQGNEGTVGAGGLWIHNPDEPGEVLVACNELLENSGAAVGGLLIGDGLVAVHNNAFNANTGERGALFATSDAVGLVANNTMVSNQSAPGSGAGVESSADLLDFTGNIVAFNQVGWGAVRSTTGASWTHNLMWSNAGGDWSGTAGLPDPADGNLALEPDFVAFTIVGGLDDDLSLQEGSPLLDLGSTDGLLLDLDGSRNALGLDGGPKTGCDADGDGVRVDEGDCRPDDPAFHPGAHEATPGLDSDCSGFALLDERTFKADDGAAVATGPWEFALPTALPGLGYQGQEGWCTVCAGSPAAFDQGDLTFDFDLSGVLGGAQLELVHAWDLPEAEGGAVAQWFDGAGWSQLEPELGYPADGATSGDLAALSILGMWSGSGPRWTPDTFDVGAASGGVLQFRVHADVGPVAGGAGWSVGRVAVAIEDADEDQRAGSEDCDDADPDRYVGAPELPYDGVDQDCDGVDLTDVDGDGFDGGTAGDDCDDEDPGANPDGLELPYDGVDQDCDGADLDDVDGDGHAAEEAGGDDCDDEDPAVHGAATELPYDGVDQDCDGEDLVDVDGDGHPGTGADGPLDCDDEEPLAWPGNLEFCADGVDNDCDGLVDRQGDGDGDGFDLCDGDCDDTRAAVRPDAEEACDGLDTDCDGVLELDELDRDADGALACAGDCDDGDPARAASFVEVCDGVDNDCDLGVDEGHDGDGDGFSGCTTDCDDQRSAVYPGADISCDSNLDHDCDGVRDFEQPACTNPSGCSQAGRGANPLLLLLLLGGRSMSKVPLNARRRRGRSMTHAHRGSAPTGPSAPRPPRASPLPR